MSSFSICNDQSFLKLIYALDPAFVVPNRKSIKQNILTNFDAGISEVREIKSKVNLTADGWVSITNDPYLAFTAHFVNNNNQLCSFVLDFSISHIYTIQTIYTRQLNQY